MTAPDITPTQPAPIRRPDVNHWGVWINQDTPITGVFTNWKAPAGFWDDVNDGINLTCVECQKAHQVDLEEDLCDSCEPQGDILAGKWLKDADGKYYHDPEGEYAAIVGEIYTQVVFSTKTRRCALCSPCYPGQGDLEAPGDFLAYCLPFGEEGES